MNPDSQNFHPAHEAPFFAENRGSQTQENQELSEAAGCPNRRGDRFFRITSTELQWRFLNKNRESEESAGKIFYKIG